MGKEIALKNEITNDVVQKNGKMKCSDTDIIINLDQGNPTLLAPYWRERDEKCKITISGSQFLSYFSDPTNLCWFMEPKLKEEIKKLHQVIGNASVENYNMVVGNGSTQLIHAALYALCPPHASEPVDVVAAAPYYSCYSETTNLVGSRLYKWSGDANRYDKEGPYIEFVTYPNNPDGSMREAIVKGYSTKGKLIHDLAYYWPQYTPITHCANHDIMLFTISKCTGHAGSRIGWALVKDDDVARKMTQYITINTIGVSKESQHRAAMILGVVADNSKCPDIQENYFLSTYLTLAQKWEKLREVIGCNEIFTLPTYPQEFCNFEGKIKKPNAAYAWLKCNDKIEDLEKFLREHNIIARSGLRFGSDKRYVRISMLGAEEDFNLFLERLFVIQKSFD